MGYTTDFDGEFTVAPPLRPEHRASLEALDGLEVADLRDSNLPHSECHWKPLDQDGAAFGWDGVVTFTEYRGWLAYVIGHFLEPWGYRLDGIVTWQGEEDDDRGVITVEANHVTVVGRKGPWSESEPSRSRYWPPDKQARLLARFHAGADQSALAEEFGTWPVLVRTRLKRYGLMPNDETASKTDWLDIVREQSGTDSMLDRLDALEAIAAESVPTNQDTTDEEPSGSQARRSAASEPPHMPRRPTIDSDLMASRQRALAELRAKRARQMQQRAEPSED